MAKPGSGKRKMANFEKRQWRQTTKSLRSTGRSISSGWKKEKGALKKPVMSPHACTAVMIVLKCVSLEGSETDLLHQHCSAVFS